MILEPLETSRTTTGISEIDECLIGYREIYAGRRPEVYRPDQIAGVSRLFGRDFEIEGETYFDVGELLEGLE